MALEKLGVDGSDCLFVGDGASGELDGAERVGMTPVLICPPDEDPRWTDSGVGQGCVSRRSRKFSICCLERAARERCSRRPRARRSRRLLRHQPGPRERSRGAPFANPRNDFWRLLHAAGFTPRLLEPQEAGELSRYESASRMPRAGRRATRRPAQVRLRRRRRAARGDRTHLRSPWRSASWARSRTPARSEEASSTACSKPAWAGPRSSSSRRPHRRTRLCPGTSASAGSVRFGRIVS